MKHVYVFYKCYASDDRNGSKDIEGIYSSFEEAKAAANSYMSHFGTQGPYIWKRVEFYWWWDCKIENNDFYVQYSIARYKFNKRWWE